MATAIRFIRQECSGKIVVKIRSSSDEWNQEFPSQVGFRRFVEGCQNKGEPLLLDEEAKAAAGLNPNWPRLG